MTSNCNDEWHIPCFETSAATGWNVDSAFFCAIFQVLKPCLEVVENLTASMTNVQEADKMSQIIDDSIKTRNPTVLLEKIDSVCKEPQNLS